MPDFYWTVPEDLQYIWYALGDAVQGIGGCFAIYTWGIWRAYRLLTMNEEYWRRKKKNDKKDIFIDNIINSLFVDRLWEQNKKMCRIEIRNENSTDVITLEQQSQADVDDFSMRTNGPNARTLMKNWFLNM